MQSIKSASGRLFSLDFLRGADIFFLTVLSVLLYAVNEYSPLPKGLVDQLMHPDWVGFTVYDLIMPLFIFMCGAALPLALPRRLEENGKAGLKYWRHVFTRVAMLWVLGMIAQGKLFSLDLHEISFFNNTLQTIAVGYLITAVVALIPSKSVQILVPFLLAAGYTAFLHLCGDMTATGNAAVVYETKFLRLFYSNESWWAVRQIADMHYTWWATVPMFGVMGLAGYHATKILRDENRAKIAKAKLLFFAGLLQIALGLVLSFTFDPCIKHIFTASFTFLAMGASFVLYSLCYWLFDIVEWRRGTSLISLFGRRSLLAYMLAETCFKALPASFPAAVLPGVKRFLSDGQFKLLATVLECAFLVFIVYVWDGFKKEKREKRVEGRG